LQTVTVIAKFLKVTRVIILDWRDCHANRLARLPPTYKGTKRELLSVVTNIMENSAHREPQSELRLKL
jgi:hypothetical protein